MRCREVVEILREGRELSHDALVHARACPACAEEARFWGGVRSELRREVDLPTHLHTRIMATVRAEARAAEERRSWITTVLFPRWVIPALVACVVLLGEGYFGFSLFKPPPADLEVVWSEQQALLLAQGSTPERLGGGEFEKPPAGARLFAPEPQADGDLTASRVSAPPPSSEELRQAKPSGDLTGSKPPVGSLVPTSAPARVEEEAFQVALADRPSAEDRFRGRNEGYPAEEAPREKADLSRKKEAGSGEFALRSAPPAPSAGPSLEQDEAISGEAKSAVTEAGVAPCVPCVVESGGRPVGQVCLAPHLAPPPGPPLGFSVGSAPSKGRDAESPSKVASAEVVEAILRQVRLGDGAYTLRRP